MSRGVESMYFEEGEEVFLGLKNFVPVINADSWDSIVFLPSDDHFPIAQWKKSISKKKVDPFCFHFMAFVVLFNNEMSQITFFISTFLNLLQFMDDPLDPVTYYIVLFPATVLVGLFFSYWAWLGWQLFINNWTAALGSSAPRNGPLYHLNCEAGCRGIFIYSLWLCHWQGR